MEVEAIDMHVHLDGHEVEGVAIVTRPSCNVRIIHKSYNARYGWAEPNVSIVVVSLASTSYHASSAYAHVFLLHFLGNAMAKRGASPPASQPASQSACQGYLYRLLSIASVDINYQILVNAHSIPGEIVGFQKTHVPGYGPSKQQAASPPFPLAKLGTYKDADPSAL